MGKEIDNAQIEFIGDDDEEVDGDLSALNVVGQSLITSIMEGTPSETIKSMVDQGVPLWYQDEEGLTALHAAAYREDRELIRYLLEKGATWNLVDNLGNTAGDIALSFNNETCYHLIRDAGIRSEYLLSYISPKHDEPDIQNTSTIILQAEDNTSSGSSEEFLKSRLRFTKDVHGQDICLVKAGDDEVGVMMGWERGIMQETVHRLCDNDNTGLRVLNIGFGLGIIDSMFQSLQHPPKHHVIIEAHPDVLEHMRGLGWYEKPGVKILEGKWQSFLDSEELLSVGGFDAVYTDTFSENYKDLHEFFKQVPTLLRGPDAKFSFFNGLGATNTLFYDVYTELSELHLSKVGLDTSWYDVDVGENSTGETIWGDTRKYFTMRTYRLPIARLKEKMSTV